MTNEKVLPTKLEPGKDQVVAAPKPVETVSNDNEHLVGSREPKRGDKGEDVKVLQRLLQLEDTGVFNEDTEEKIKWLQRVKNQKETGTATKDVWHVLGYRLP